MSHFPEDLFYTPEHFWVKEMGEVVLCGITDHAQNELGDVVFVEMPQVGTTVKKGERVGDVESAKTISNLYAPLSGKILEINEVLKEKPELVNQDPYGKGWIFKLKPLTREEFSSLLKAEDYRKIVENV
ncbi:MAG: glycine cleavage system protein GcvH [Candidatus Caldatribacteriaceae bacterium]